MNFFISFKGLPALISINSYILSLNSVLILTNIADPGEMLPYVAFHLGLLCSLFTL